MRVAATGLWIFAVIAATYASELGDAGASAAEVGVSLPVVLGPGARFQLSSASAQSTRAERRAAQRRTDPPLCKLARRCAVRAVASCASGKRRYVFGVDGVGVGLEEALRHESSAIASASARKRACFEERGVLRLCASWMRLRKSVERACALIETSLFEEADSSCVFLLRLLRSRPRRIGVGSPTVRVARRRDGKDLRMRHGGGRRACECARRGLRGGAGDPHASSDQKLLGLTVPSQRDFTLEDLHPREHAGRHDDLEACSADLKLAVGSSNEEALSGQAMADCRA